MSVFASQCYTNVNGYLLSGASGISTGSLECFGTSDKINIYAEGISGNSMGNSSGTLNLQIRLEPSSSWITVQNTPFTNSSGILYPTIQGPIEAIRARVTAYTSGLYNVVYAIQG